MNHLCLFNRSHQYMSLFFPLYRNVQVAVFVRITSIGEFFVDEELPPPPPELLDECSQSYATLPATAKNTVHTAVVCLFTVIIC
jgi:hypothetical protein